MIRRPPSSTRTYTLFPYTTLFRSRRGGIGVEGPLMLHLLAAARARRLEIEQVEDLAFSHEGATRQAARQDFRQGREIRRDAIFLLGAAGRHAEPGHHFVEDQNDPDRKSVELGKSVSVRVALGCRLIIKKKQIQPAKRHRRQ